MLDKHKLLLNIIKYLFIVPPKFFIYMPCKYLMYKSYNYCIYNPYNNLISFKCCKKDKQDTKHNKYHKLQEKYSDLNENYNMLENKVNHLITLANQNNSNIIDELESFFISVDTKLIDMEKKINISQKQNIPNISRNNNKCYWGKIKKNKIKNKIKNIKND